MKLMYKVVHCTNWVLVFPQQLSQEAETLQQELRSAARNIGMEISEPRRISFLDDRERTYLNVIDSAVNGFNPQIVVALVKNDEASLYNMIKRRCILHKPVPSQVTIARTVRSRNFQFIATNIARQMNAKLGGVPRHVDIPLKNAMIVGLDGSRRWRSFGALVATTNDDFSKFFVQVRNLWNGGKYIGMSRYVGIDIRQAAERNAQNSGKLPGSIFVYRDGVGRKQEEYVKETEIRNIKHELKKLYKDNLPKITFVIVNKRTYTGNENPPRLADDVVTSHGEYDFFLGWQCFRFRTVTATHYKVILDEVKLGPDEMQSLTYKLSHSYYNWNGPVRVPNVVQYAQKAAMLTSEVIGVEPPTDLSDSLYFL